MYNENIMNILETKNITFGYKTKKILDDISFSVQESDLLGIIGPNGAGKTTLFKTITRLLKPWNGKIFLNGNDISSLSTRDVARTVATMPQFLEVPFSFTVEEFVKMGRYPFKNKFESLNRHDFEAIENALSLTDTLPLRERLILELSGGERQRVVLAQALCQEPKLLLLDEPTAHLDIGHQIEILDLIKKLSKQNKLTVIVVLHDLNLASEYCNKIALLNNGKLFRYGGPEQVLTYQNIEEVYKTCVVVKNNPVTKKPYIFPVPDEFL